MTPGHGTWEQVGKGQYKYTWYTYGVDELGQPLYTVRVRGLAANDGCDTIKISYAYEVFAPAFPPQNVEGDILYSTSGNAEESRVPVAALD